MIDEERRRLVLDRLHVAKRVFEQNEALRARHDLFAERNGGWTHAYADHDAIVSYLLLTCFDILGRKDGAWLPFDTWLVADRTRERRDETAKRLTNAGPIEAAKALHRAYQDDFGTTQGFFRFIEEVLTAPAREALLYSVRVSDKVMGADTDGDQGKREFLYELRNRFTHRGIVSGSHARAIAPTTVIVEDGRAKWGWEAIRHDDAITYGVRRWPFVLFETIFGALGEPVDDDYSVLINASVETPGGHHRFFKNLPYAALHDIPSLVALAEEQSRRVHWGSPQ